MITPSFSLTATERVLPKLALDFTTGSLDSRVTFTRTTDSTHPATYVNSSGVITAATNNQPRFDYDPITLACKGLLIEESRTNVIPYNSEFNDATWTKAACSISTNAATAPDGTSDADKMVENSATDYHYISITKTLSAATAYTTSIYAKAAGRSFINLQYNGTGYANQGVSVNLTTGAKLEYNSPTSTSVTDAGNGWWRITLTATTTGTNVIPIILLSSSLTNNPIYTGNGTNGVYLWGAQTEAGAFATSVIPNVGNVTNTRNADVATMTGTNFSDWYNQSEGAFEIDANYKGFVINEMLLTVTDGALGAYMQSYWPSSTSIQLDAKAGSGQIVITSAINTDIKYVFAYKDNSYAAAVSGNAVSTSSTLKSSTGVTQLNIGHRNGSLPANAWFKKIMYWPQRLINNEVRAFSK